MPVIAITSGLYSGSEKLISKLEKAFPVIVFTDRDLIEKTSQDCQINPDLLIKAVKHKPIPFNRFTHEREKALASLKLTIARCLSQGDCLFHGMISHIFPASLAHILKILITAPDSLRMNRGMIIDDRSENSAAAAMARADRYLEEWTREYTGKPPWDPSLYHLILPVEDLDRGQTLEQIEKKLTEPMFTLSNRTKEKTQDFTTTCEVELALADICHGLMVVADDGHLTVTLDKKVLNLAKVQQKILSAARRVNGVKSVRTKIGPNYYKGRILKNFDFGTSTDPHD